MREASELEATYSSGPFPLIRFWPRPAARIESVSDPARASRLQAAAFLTLKRSASRSVSPELRQLHRPHAVAGRLEPRRSWPDRLSGAGVPVAHTLDCFLPDSGPPTPASVRGGAGATGGLWVAGPQEEAGLSRSAKRGRAEERGLGDRKDVREAWPLSAAKPDATLRRPRGAAGRSSAPEAPRLPPREAGREGLSSGGGDVTPSWRVCFHKRRVMGCLCSRVLISTGSQRPEGQRGDPDGTQPATVRPVIHSYPSYR